MPLQLPSDTGHTDIRIENLQDGDLASFKHLYNLHFEEFVGAAENILEDKKEAPSLVKHCFIKCWLRSSQLTSMEYVLGFLNFTMRNNCLASKNSKKYKSPHFKHILEAILSKNALGGDSGSENVNRIHNLSSEQIGSVREVFGRFYSRRMTVQKIADELGLTPEYTEERLKLAFQILHHLVG